MLPISRKATIAASASGRRQSATPAAEQRQHGDGLGRVVETLAPGIHQQQDNGAGGDRADPERSARDPAAERDRAGMAAHISIRIGYSATQLKTCGAIRPAESPPSMPPADIHM